jgi:WD40 repeat protein
LIALGGKLSEFALMDMNGGSIKAEDVDLRAIYSMTFEGDLLYILGSDGKNAMVKVLNTKSNEVKLLKELDKKAEQMALHPNGKLAGIGYKDGTVAIFNVKSWKEPVAAFEFDDEKMDGEITALKFDEVSNRLAIGTSKGFIGIIPEMEDGTYLLGSLKARKTHVFRISAIDFKEYKNTVDNSVQSIMAVGSYDGTVSVWQLSKFTTGLYEPFMFEYHNVEGKNSWVTSLEFIENPDDNEHHQLVVGYFNGTIKFWGLEVQGVANDLRCALGDSFKGKLKFSDDEVEKYHLKVDEFDVRNYVECDN